MKKIIKYNKNQSGSTLLIVVGLMAIVFIMVTSGVTVAVASQNQTYNSFEEQQAQYSAQSALNLFVSEANKNDALNSYLAGLSVGSNPSSSGNVDFEGSDISYSIDKIADDKVKVTVESTYMGFTSTSAVLMKITQTNSLDFNGAICSNSANLANGCSTSGDVFSNSTTNLTNSFDICGNLFFNGDGELNSYAAASPGKDGRLTVVSTGNLHITNEGNFGVPDTAKDGSYINSGGTIKVDSHPTIGTPTKPIDVYGYGLNSTNNAEFYSDVFIYNDGNTTPFVTLKNGTTIHGDLYVDGDIEFSGSATVEGTIYCSGNVTRDDGTTLPSNVEVLTGMPPKPPIESPDDVFASLNPSNTFADGTPCTAEGRIAGLPVSNTTIDLTDDRETILDAGGNPVEVQKTITSSGALTDTKWNGTYKIKVGVDPIVLKIPDGFSSNAQITIEREAGAEDTPVYFITDPNSSLDFNNGFRIITGTTQDKIDHNETFNVNNYKDESKDVTYGENILWLLGDGSSLKLSSSPTAISLIEGYIYGPGASVEFSEDGTEFNYSIDGDSSATLKASLIGAIISDKTKISNDNGILYLQQPASMIGTNPSANATFTVEQYSRN